MNIVLGVVVGTIVAVATAGNKEENKKEMYSSYLAPCTHAHSHSGLNYVWLEKDYGILQNVKFEEPVNSGKWRDYTDEIWKIHCKVVSHDPKKLVQEHVKAFVDPKTRFARLIFTFKKNGKVYSREPDRRFYELEKRFFENEFFENEFLKRKFE